MANTCIFTLIAVSKSKEAIDRLANIFEYKDKKYYLYRVFDPCCQYIGEENGLHKLTICGAVAWTTDRWFENVEDTTTMLSNGAHYITLDKLCKILNIGVEVFGEEGCQEHWLCNHNGKIVVNECADVDYTYDDENGNELSEPILNGGLKNYGDFKSDKEIYGDAE